MNSALKAERQAHEIGILSGACLLFLLLHAETRQRQAILLL